MASSTTNLDVTAFDPKQPSKRKVSEDVLMEVTSDSGVSSTRSSTGRPPNNKRRRRIKSVSETKEDVRKISVPAHRYTPLKEKWMEIFEPITQHLKLQIKFNLATRQVEIKKTDDTPDIANLQKAADFVKAFVYGFEVGDALALLRIDDLFIETFQIKDVKTLQGDHQSRAIGRLAGKGGRTKFTIENATKTRIVLADSKVHILGSFQNIQLARRAICNLIIGSPPSKVYGHLRNSVNSISERI